MRPPDPAYYTIEEERFYKGFEYQIIAINLGFRCGYVKLPKELQDVDVYALNVHGGITYKHDEIIGFDCGHYCDKYDVSIIAPESQEFAKLMNNLNQLSHSKIWQTEDVRAECHSLIDQLIEKLA